MYASMNIWQCFVHIHKFQVLNENQIIVKKLRQSQLNDISDSKLPESMGVVPSEFNNFPPDVPDASLRRKIIGDFWAATQPSKFEEAGCAVCGALTLRTELFDLSSLNIDLGVLNTVGLGFTQKERKNSAEPVSELEGPVIDTSCGYICISCKDKLRHRKLPKFALARGLWLHSGKTIVFWQYCKSFASNQ